MRVDQEKLYAKLYRSFGTISDNYESAQGEPLPDLSVDRADQLAATLRDHLGKLGLDANEAEQLRSAAAGALLMVGLWESMGVMFDLYCSVSFRNYCQILMDMADSPGEDLTGLEEAPKPRRRWGRR